MANRLLQLTREGYQLGELDLLTVLDTQRTYLAVQSGYYRALKDYYLSAINMEELVGRELIFQSKKRLIPTPNHPILFWTKCAE